MQGKIVGKAVKEAHRSFLAFVHPDLFLNMGHCQKLNKELIQRLQWSMELILKSWLDEKDLVDLDRRPEIVSYFHKDQPNKQISIRMPFRLSNSPPSLDPDAIGNFGWKALATKGLLNLFAYKNPEIMRFLDAKIMASLQESSTAYPSGEFQKILLRQERPMEIVETVKLDRMQKLSFIRFDSRLCISEKTAGIKVLTELVGFLEGFQRYLGYKTPIIYVTKDVDVPEISSDFIRLPVSFIGKGTNYI